MIKVSDITIEKIRNGQLQNKLPEFFELKKCIENNNWHKNDSVFSHTLNVLEELKKLLKIINNKINSYLNQKIDNYSKRDLLFLSTLFHDIGKIYTITTEENKFTSCLKHEKVGSEKVKDILKRFDLSKKEKAIVINIIKYHGEIHPIFSSKNTNIEKQFADFKQRHHDIFIELILLGMSDTFGSQLRENNMEEYNFRSDFYKRIIEN